MGKNLLNLELKHIKMIDASTLFYPSSQMEWRNWLIKNHENENSIWLKYFKVNSGKPSLTWSDAVDEALCFGWIDSTRKTLDSESFIQLFTKRKPSSTWSKINKEKIERLLTDGLMYPSGIKCIEIAKENGNWTILDSVEDLIIPDDLRNAFDHIPDAYQFYENLSNSDKKMCLHRLVMAKKEETRKKRIEELIEQLSLKKRPTAF